MRFIKSGLLVAVAVGSIAATTAIAQPAPASVAGAENGECVVVPGYKGRWYLKEGQWYRCRKSGAGLWVPAGAGAALAGAGAAGGAGVVAAGVGVAAAAGIGIAASGGNDGPGSP